MTEINNNLRAEQQVKQLLQRRPRMSRQERDNRPTRADANRMSGLASGIDTKAIIKAIVDVERRRLEPVQEQREDTLDELESFKLINESLERLKTTADSLRNNSIWEGKVVESSNEDVVTATATRGAKPGKHTLVVDKLALNHQIASQGYEKQDENVGSGRFIITVGEGNPISIIIDETNNTLKGLKEAINFATDEVNATLIKTGNRLRPNQLVLTSQKSGSEGRIALEVNLKGGDTPFFENSVEAPTEWAGIGEPIPPQDITAITGTGASTSIVQVVGDYNGEDDLKFTFSAIQTGIVGGEKQMQVRWEDEDGRKGVLNLDALNYAPGQPIEFVDGLALIFSAGEIIVNDSFSFQARSERSSVAWYLTPEERKSSTSQLTTWARQQTEEFGAPTVEGTYTGEDDQEFTLTVEGNGIVGRAKSLSIVWANEEGDSGILTVGEGYEPGTALALTQGLTVALKPGVLSNGQVSTFEVEAAASSSLWWKSFEERREPAVVSPTTRFALADADEDEPSGFMPELPGELGPRVSTSEKTITGTYTGDDPRVYTFTVIQGAAIGDKGTVGTTSGLRIGWEDDKGNSGVLDAGTDYTPGTPLPFDLGLSVSFGPGRVFEEDFFTVRTRTATIQPPQDAVIRFGASEGGGGLEITSSTNAFENLIDGVRLNVISTDEKPVTISIRGDTEKAKEAVLQFVTQFNSISALITELSKFEPENEFAGPLLGNRDITQIRNRLSELLIDPVKGLPKSANMLFSLGVKLNNKGILDADDAVLDKKIKDDFGLVADLFRDKGESDNQNIAFVGMSEETSVSTDGYPVNITKVATQGYYQSLELPQVVIVDDTNNKFSVTVDGRPSEQIELAPRAYQLNEFARTLQNAIVSDDLIGDRGVRVLAENNRIRVLSGRFGTSSSIIFSPGLDKNKLPAVLDEGESVAGENIEGTINGNPAEGNGQLLKAPNNSGPAAGLRLFSKMSESQLDPQAAEASVSISKGIGSRLSSYLETVVNPLTGSMGRITKNLRDRIGDLDGQLKRMEERIDSKRQRLREKFTRMETKLSSLRSQQAFMKGQLGGGGSALPGLPG